MTCNVPPFASAVLREADQISPGRRRSSDGVCGDAAHAAEHSDHNPSGPNNYAHAVDCSHSVPGAPFWEPRFQQFDAMHWARVIGGRMVAGVERRPTYLVANFGGPDMILDPAVSPGWRQNGSYKTDHRSHVHVSFGAWAEQSTAPFFEIGDPPVTDAEIQKVVSRTVAALTPVIREQCATAVKNALGGYVGGSDPWVDGALAAALRSERGLTKP